MIGLLHIVLLSLKPSGLRLHTRLRSVWSNEQAVKDYKDFLEGKPNTVIRSTDQPSVFIVSGHGPFANKPEGRLLHCCITDDDVVLRADDPLPVSVGSFDRFPIYVLLSDQELAAFLSSSNFQSLRLSSPPSDKMADFVFVHAGGDLLESLLRTNSVGGTAQTTLCLQDGLVPRRGSTSSFSLVSNQVSLGLDAMGRPKFAGRSIVSGTWAGSVKERIDTCAKVLVSESKASEEEGVVDLGFQRDIRRTLFEMSILHCVINLVGAVHQKSSKSTLTYQDSAMYVDEVVDMIQELGRSLKGGLAVVMTYGYEERIVK